jgi:demethylmenaquinone methyltransferase/2-methoxy-6-polyprenyl-1,4-benzoquinol methylase
MNTDTDTSAIAPSDSQKRRARAVRDMFGTIAGRYDFLNHFLSANFDRRWRRACVREVARLILIPHPRILDVGCGTADLSLAFSGLGPVVGCDFSHPMLRLGLAKTANARCSYPVHLLEGDALSLPFPDAGFDAVVSAFVLRNLADISQGLSEMRRMLRPGGVLAILDFGLPDALILGRLYRFYFTRILPRLGKLISGVDGPYKYLPDSVSTFPPPGKLTELIKQAGFIGTEYRSLSAGIAILLLGRIRA